MLCGGVFVLWFACEVGWRCGGLLVRLCGGVFVWLFACVVVWCGCDGVVW